MLVERRWLCINDIQLALLKEWGLWPLFYLSFYWGTLVEIWSFWRFNTMSLNFCDMVWQPPVDLNHVKVLHIQEFVSRLSVGMMRCHSVSFTRLVWYFLNLLRSWWFSVKILLVRLRNIKCLRILLLLSLLISGDVDISGTLIAFWVSDFLSIPVYGINCSADSSQFINKDLWKFRRVCHSEGTIIRFSLCLMLFVLKTGWNS